MKIILFVCSLAILPFSRGDQSRPKYGPAKHPYAITLARSHGHLSAGGSPDFWALVGYYVPQINGYACSAASVAMVLNAARSPMSKTSDDKLITQQDLLESTNVVHWKERLNDDGFEGGHGLNLDQLAQATESAFRSNGFPKATVTVTHVHDNTAKTLTMVRKALISNENTAQNFIIANFNQKYFTDDADAGHIAPVGAYDDAGRRVLVFDPDRDWYEPYWVSLQTFVSGMATTDKGAAANRGFIVIHLNR